MLLSGSHEAVEVVGVEVEDNVGVEEEEEDLETVKVKVSPVVSLEVKVKVKVKVKGKATPILAIKPSVIQIHLLSRPVFVTGPSEKVHIFVWNQGHVPGRTSLSPSPTNEALTRSTIDKTTRSFMTCYITKNCQKYIP